MKKTWAISTILMVISLGCGGKEEIRPSDDSLLTTAAIEKVDAIRIAYQEKDQYALGHYITPELMDVIKPALHFEEAQLSFTPRMVRITLATEIMVNLNWHGSWVIRGNRVEDRGIAVFVLEGDPMRLTRAEGSNPFVSLIPDVQAPTEEPAGLRTDREQTDSAIQVNREPDPSHAEIEGLEQETHDVDDEASPEEDTPAPDETPKQTVGERPDTYTIQVGSWKTPRYALETMEKLRTDFPDIYVVISGSYHVLRISGVPDREKVNQILMELREKFGLEAILLRKDTQR